MLMSRPPLLGQGGEWRAPLRTAVERSDRQGVAHKHYSFQDFLEHVWISKLNSGDSLYVLNFASFWKSFEEDLSDL